MKVMFRLGSWISCAVLLVSCAQSPPPASASAEKPAPPPARRVPPETLRKIEASMVPIPGGVLPAGYLSDFVAKGGGKKAGSVPVAAFRLGRHEVTREEWSEVMGENPIEDPEEARLPVADITWGDAQEFIARLNEAEGAPIFRLPTAAEWAYGCRAGAEGWRDPPSAAALSRVGWWGINSGGRPHPVERLKPNRWGLYDMMGNVDEWCADESEPLEGSAMRPIAGGNFVDENVSGHGCRVAGALGETGSEPYTGFRLARSSPAAPGPRKKR